MNANKAPNSRQVAVRALARVLEQGQSLTEALAAELSALGSPRDRAFAQALAFGVLRNYWRLEAILAQLARKPIQVPEVRWLALAGLQQLSGMAVKPYAAVAETVAAAGRHAWAKPLLNAILRNYQRNREAIEAALADDLPAQTSHPQWLIERLRGDWPEHWQAILEANNQQAPMVLRANRRRQSRADYLALLQQQGIAATAGAGEDAIVLEAALDVALLPGFADGLASVQDAAAQWAAVLLDAQPGQRVLDACAAPGGKTAHVLERCPQVEVSAVDIAPERLQRTAETLRRLGLSAHLLQGDAGRPRDWWDGQLYQRILLDAPCSATGVIRRHPDIKWLRRAGDIAALAATQATMLQALWPLLAPGGVLLYATCSVLREENDRQIAAFLQSRADAVELPVDLGFPALAATPHGRQILPGEQGMDGFFYAKLAKRGG